MPTAYEKFNQATIEHHAAIRAAEQKLQAAATEYHQGRHAVKIGASVIECPSEKIPPSLIVGLVRENTSTYQYKWRLSRLKKDGMLSKQHRYLSAEAPITVLGEYNGEKWERP